jgi:hypothetical protein
MIQKYKTLSSTPNSSLYIQKYSSHPWMYLQSTAIKAFDLIATGILNSEDNGEMSILYLGDSENDNSGFKRASVSIGITSDKRLTPKLDCQYLIGFKQLSDFLKHLVHIFRKSLKFVVDGLENNITHISKTVFYQVVRLPLGINGQI